jgi:hypothetical protein
LALVKAHPDAVVKCVKDGLKKLDDEAYRWKYYESLERSELVDDIAEREAYEEAIRHKQAENDEVTEFLTRYERHMTRIRDMFGNVPYFYQVVQGNSKPKLSQDQKAVIEEERDLSALMSTLRKRHRVRETGPRCAEELRRKLHKIAPYVRDLRPFTPSNDEVNAYLQENFDEILDGDY